MRLLEITTRNAGQRDNRMAINPATIINMAPDSFQGTRIRLLPDGNVFETDEPYDTVMARLRKLDNGRE